MVGDKMGTKITIYENGQTYEIDSDLIYVPIFEKENKNENRERDTE